MKKEHISKLSEDGAEVIHINVPGNVSLAEPCPTSPLHIVDSHAEIMQIFPIYQSLSKEAKQRVLDNVKKWIKSEEAQLDNIVENQDSTQQLKDKISEFRESLEWYRDNVDRGYANGFLNNLYEIQKLSAV